MTRLGYELYFFFVVPTLRPQKKEVSALRPQPWRTVFGPADAASTFFARRAVLLRKTMVNYD
jgi:hypothetical protein